MSGGGGEATAEEEADKYTYYECKSYILIIKNK